MLRAQHCTASNYATASQERPQRPAQSPDSPTHCQINAVRRAPHFQTPANSNTNFSANQSPALFLAFCVLPWRQVGPVQTRSGAELARPVTDALSLAFPSTFYPGLGSIGGLVLTRRGAIEVDAGPLKLAVEAPLPGPSQWEPKLLSQSALGAQSGVLRAALETGWPNPNPEGCFTYTASRCSFCVPPCSIASPLAFGQWTRLQARGPRREHSSQVSHVHADSHQRASR